MWRLRAGERSPARGQPDMWPTEPVIGGNVGHTSGAETWRTGAGPEEAQDRRKGGTSLLSRRRPAPKPLAGLSSRGLPAPAEPAEIVRCILDSLALAYRQALLAAQSLSGRHA